MSEENLKQNNNENISAPKMLHTYMSDMANVVRENEVSVIKVALEEQKKREREEEFVKIEGTPKKKIFWAFGGLIILLGAFVLSYFVIQKNPKKDIPNEIITTKESLIHSENKIEIDATTAINKIDISNILGKEVSVKNESESIKEIFLNKKNNELTNVISIENLFTLINTNTPGQLIRSFSEEYMIGSYTPLSAYDRNHLFLIIKINDYDQAYAGMLEWEKTMLDDLYSVFQINISNLNKDIFEKPFKDIIVKNKDTRILYTDEGADVLLYLFPDKNTLIITDNQEAVKEIITRLLAKQSKPL